MFISPLLRRVGESGWGLGDGLFTDIMGVKSGSRVKGQGSSTWVLDGKVLHKPLHNVSTCNDKVISAEDLMGV